MSEQPEQPEQPEETTQTTETMDDAVQVQAETAETSEISEVADSEVAASEEAVDAVETRASEVDTDDDTEDDDDHGAQASSRGRGKRVQNLEREGDIAADYLEELLDIADLDGDLDMDVDGDRSSVSIVGADLNQLVGRDGEVLDALQELTRLAVYRETGERSRLMLDVSGYRAEKRERLVALAAEVIERVKASGSPESLDPMDPFERKVVHDEVSAAGLVSESSGTEPRRYVVVQPA